MKGMSRLAVQSIELVKDERNGKEQAFRDDSSLCLGNCVDELSLGNIWRKKILVTDRRLVQILAYCDLMMS